MTIDPDKNGAAPVTHAELSSLAGEMTTRFNFMDVQFQEVRDELQEVRNDLGGLQRGLESVLNVVTSIDEQLRELKTLPARVERLERSRR